MLGTRSFVSLKLVCSGAVILALAGCGQTGPLYPKAELAQPAHHYDTFLLLPDKSQSPATTTKDKNNSSTATTQPNADAATQSSSSANTQQ